MSEESDNKKIKIDPDYNLADFIEEYPQLVEVLMVDYNFHCANCIFSGFDTLKEGAAIHGIEGKDFDDMITHLEEVINSETEDN